MVNKIAIVGIFAALSVLFFLLVNYVEMYIGLMIILGLALLTSLIFFFYYLGMWCGVNWKEVGRAIEEFGDL